MLPALYYERVLGPRSKNVRLCVLLRTTRCKVLTAIVLSPDYKGRGMHVAELDVVEWETLTPSLGQGIATGACAVEYDTGDDTVVCKNRLRPVAGVGIRGALKETCCESAKRDHCDLGRV